MKKKLLWGLLLLSHMGFSQTQDLAKLASGEYLGFNAIFDQDDDVYGYISLYGHGKSTDKTNKFEYVLLDKNLNPVANKTFEGDITAKNYIGVMDFKGKIILRPSEYDSQNIKSKEFFRPRSMEIDPKKNIIQYKKYYDYKDGKFEEISEPKKWSERRKENKEEKREKGFIYRSFVYEIKEGGYLAIEFNDYESYIENNNLIKFDENKKELWRYSYNTGGEKKTKEELTIIEKDKQYIYGLLQENGKKEKTFYLLILDMNTGKEVIKKPITGVNEYTLENITRLNDGKYIDNDKTFDDKIVVLGTLYDDKKYDIGFTRLIIDRKSHQYEIKTLQYLDLKSGIPNIKKRGGVENGYFLITKDLFFLKNGSVGILMEKYQPMTQYNNSKTTDLVYVFTNEDFSPKGIQIFEKAKTKRDHNDYLFSQYLNGGKDVVFFYRDLQKDDVTREKKWNLFINTLIDGKFQQEIVPISSKNDFFVFPYVGKQGYILLHEFNAKEKFNKIRLERLNY